MGMMTTFPVRLTLEESSAAALAAAAEDLNGALDAESFVSALNDNHRLWMALSQIEQRRRWGACDRRLTDFVVKTSRKAGRRVDDDHIETLIVINKEVSARLSGGRDLESILRRAVLAWKESGAPRSTSLKRWLLAEILRKARLLH